MTDLHYIVVISRLCLTNKSKHSYKYVIKDDIGHNCQTIFSQDVSPLGKKKKKTKSVLKISPKSLPQNEFSLVCP